MKTFQEFVAESDEKCTVDEGVESHDLIADALKRHGKTPQAGAVEAAHKVRAYLKGPKGNHKATVQIKGRSMVLKAHELSSEQKAHVSSIFNSAGVKHHIKDNEMSDFIGRGSYTNSLIHIPHAS